MIIRNSLLYILWVSTHIGALAAENQITVTVGSTAELGCTLPFRQDQPRIMWSYNDNTAVFERKGNESIAGDGYEGRVDVPEENLRYGDCTLVLENVNVNDAGEYESFVRSGIVTHIFKSVTLIVKEAPQPPKEAPVPPNNDGKGHGERRGSSNDAGMKRPHPVIILLSVVMVTASRLFL